MDKLNIQKEQERDEKQSALLAVNEAKRSILQHSLEVLVKQNLTTLDQAQDILHRFDNEDILVDAAIDSYANDKDVQDFLETLQILSNHSKDEIDEILRNGIAKGTDDLQVKTSNTTSQDEDYDIEEEEPVNNNNGVCADLYRIVSELFISGIIDDLSKSTLFTLIKNEDSRVMGVYDLYLDMKDVGDFIDSLVRIANIQVKADMNSQATKGDATDGKINLFAPQTSSPATSNGSSSADVHSPTKTGASPAKSVQSPIIHPEKDYQDNDTIQSDEDDDDEDDNSSSETSSNSLEDSDSEEEAKVLPRRLSTADYKALIQLLSNSGTIFSNDELNILNYLTDVSNKDISAAFQKYEVQKDVKELIFALKEIVVNNSENIDDDESNSEVDSLDEEEIIRDGFLSASNYKSLIVILGQSGHISSDEMKRLNVLIDIKDTSIKDAFNDYDNNKDVHRLLNSLKNICTSPKFFNNEQEQQGNDVDEDGTVSSEDVDDDDDDDDDDDESNDESSTNGKEASSVSNDSIEKKFQDIVESMELSKYETAALRLAIARGDNGEGSIREALDVFKVKGDVESLKLSLKQISYQIIKETIEEDERRIQHESEMNNTHKEHESSDDDVVVVNNEDVTADNTPTDSTNATDSSPIANKTLLSTPEARDHVFPLLCSELLKSNIFNKEDCDSLVSLYSDGWPVINAALDLYDLTGDMLDLVDTLQRVVKTTKL
jgi:hypothetical protein